MSKKLMLCLVTFFLVSGLHAQSVSVNAQVPFEFVVGDTILPAGTYTLRPTGLSSVVMLQSADSKNEMFITPFACAVDGSEHGTKLVFQVSGGQYFLWQIWTEGYDEGRQLYIRPSPDYEAGAANTVTINATAIEGAQ
jgi:hypothetical protein